MDIIGIFAVNKFYFMRNILKNSFVLVVIIALAFASCQKKKEDKISETWRLMRVSIDSTITWYELWKFDGGYLTMLKRNDSVGTLDTISTGTYVVDAGLSNTYVTIGAMEDVVNYYNGKWQVLKLNDDILTILNEETGWYYREFIKE